MRYRFWIGLNYELRIIFWRWYNINMVTTRYKKVRKLSIVQRSYIAGIIDGEGSITLTVKQKGGTRHLAVSISSTDWALLQYVKQVIGAGKIIAKRTYKPHHKPAYTYTIFNRQALSVLRQVVPHLRTYKLGRARIALAQYILVTPRNGKYNDKLHTMREKFVERFFSIVP